MSEKEKRKNDGGEEARPAQLKQYNDVLIYTGFIGFLVFTFPLSCGLCLIVVDTFEFYRGLWFYVVTSVVVAIALDMLILYAILRFGKYLDKIGRKRGKPKREQANSRG